MRQLHGRARVRRAFQRDAARKRSRVKLWSPTDLRAGCDSGRVGGNQYPPPAFSVAGRGWLPYWNRDVESSTSDSYSPALGNVPRFKGDWNHVPSSATLGCCA